MIRILALLLASALGSIPGFAFATHEVDHRYIVEGYVLAADESPIEGAAVSIYKGANRLARAVSRSDGFYRLLAHLHDSDIGSELKVRTGDSEARIVMTARAGDAFTTRLHRLSFIGGRPAEGSVGGWRVPVWIYALAGMTAVFVTLVALERRRKRLVKLNRPAKGPKSPKGKRKKRSR